MGWLNPRSAWSSARECITTAFEHAIAYLHHGPTCYGGALRSAPMRAIEPRKPRPTARVLRRSRRMTAPEPSSAIARRSRSLALTSWLLVMLGVTSSGRLRLESITSANRGLLFAFAVRGFRGVGPAGARPTDRVLPSELRSGRGPTNGCSDPAAPVHPIKTPREQPNR